MIFFISMITMVNVKRGIFPLANLCFPYGERKKKKLILQVKKSQYSIFFSLLQKKYTSNSRDAQNCSMSVLAGARIESQRKKTVHSSVLFQLLLTITRKSPSLFFFLLLHKMSPDYIYKEISTIHLLLGFFCAK